jgi:hypothetical protein
LTSPKRRKTRAVARVGLSPARQAAAEVVNSPRIYHDHGQAGSMQDSNQGPFIATGRFADHAWRFMPSPKTGKQCRLTRGVIGQGLGFRAVGPRYFQGGLGYIHPEVIARGGSLDLTIMGVFSFLHTSLWLLTQATVRVTPKPRSARMLSYELVLGERLQDDTRYEPGGGLGRPP